MALKTWNAAVCGRVDNTIKEFECCINDLEEKLERGYNRKMGEEFLITNSELEC